MRDFDQLDTSSFRAFWAASETLNFTSAAKEAGLTQSGISQHIARLENQLGVPLFHRVNKRVLLTDAGKAFRSYVDEYLDRVDQLKEVLRAENVALKGRVSYAMPAACLMTPHFPDLLKRRAKEFPDVDFDVTLATNDEIIARVINQEAHFGFVTKKVNFPGLNVQPYCKEVYVLVGNDRAQLRDVSARSLRQLPFVSHPGVDVLFDIWRNHHFPKATASWDSLTIRGRFNCIDGAINMVEAGVGLTVLPEHTVTAQLRDKVLHKFQCEKGGVTNDIYLITLQDARLPRRIQQIIEIFHELV